MNPFITADYKSPEYFCDREKEKLRLLSSIRNNRNVTLFSIRKLGKTGLLKHVLYNIHKEKKTAGIYIDLYPTKDVNGLVNEFANSMLRNLYSKPQSALVQVKNFIKGFSPSITFDRFSGYPQFEFSFRNVSETENTLKGLFSFLKEKSRKEKIVVMFDEFQQIMNYPEKNIEAMLRSDIQQLSNVVFIFSGSNSNILTSMFNKYSRPFYMSTEMFKLEKINREMYIEFIIDKFRGGKMSMTDETAAYIYEWAGGITFYIQSICNKLFGSESRKVDIPFVNETLSSILSENQSIYLGYRNFITSQQWNLLEAIAKEQKIGMPTSKDFISKYSLGTPSTVSSSMKALLKKELVYKESDFYHVTDVFLSRWLERI